VVFLLGCFSQRLGIFGPLRCGEMYALHRLLLEARVFEMVRRVVKETPGALTRPEEGNEYPLVPISKAITPQVELRLRIPT